MAKVRITGTFPRVLAVCTFVLLGAVFLSVAAQETFENGSILGTVTDESGAAMIGVTVEISSPALQVRSMTVQTDGTGAYLCVANS